MVIHKSQSAMEYLMTYGWAILIVAVVLGALYSLGIFNGANFLGGTCVASPGYLCSNPLLATDGTLSLTYGYQGPNVTIVGFACTNTTTAPSSFASSGSYNLEPGQEESVSVSCPLPSGATIGTPYSGYLWVEYDQAGQSDLIARFATVRTSASVATQPSDLIYSAAYCSTTNSFLYTMDIATGNVVNTINGPYDFEGGIAYSSVSHQLYVPSFSQGLVLIYSLPSYSLSSVSVSEPYAIAANPSGSEVWVSSFNGGISVISTSSDTVTHTISGATTVSDLRSIAFSPSGDVAYAVIASGTGNILTISTSSYSVTNIISGVAAGGSAESLAVSPDGSYIYVANYYGGPPNGANALKISMPSGTVVGSVRPTTDGNTALSLALSKDGKYLYVAGRSSGFDAISTSNFVITANVDEPAAVTTIDVPPTDTGYVYSDGTALLTLDSSGNEYNSISHSCTVISGGSIMP